MTALESGSENVPPLETVTERLLREEEKLLKGRETTEEESKLLVAGNNPTLERKLFFVITVENWATTSETVGSGPKPEQKEKTNSNLGNVTPTKMPCSSGKR